MRRIKFLRHRLYCLRSAGKGGTSFPHTRHTIVSAQKTPLFCRLQLTVLRSWVGCCLLIVFRFTIGCGLLSDYINAGSRREVAWGAKKNQECPMLPAAI